MNKDNKFRVYDKDTNKMLYTDRGEIVVSFDVIGESVYLLEKPIELSNYDLMRDTKLKDKEGKHIYEGDIVMWGWGIENPARIAIVEINPDIQFVGINIAVTFNFGNFVYRETDKYLEVVGNICENKDLLGGGINWVQELDFKK